MGGCQDPVPGGEVVDEGGEAGGTGPAVQDEYRAALSGLPYGQAEAGPYGDDSWDGPREVAGRLLSGLAWRSPETTEAQVMDLGLLRGAGDENRTRALSLGS